MAAIPEHSLPEYPPAEARIITSTTRPSLVKEVWVSTELLFSNRITWLLVLGPIALVGDATGFLGEAACFTLSGIALIPCAERLSFVTEQVAEHTNGTIGALLNATFGNAPELLISTAALRAGYYRVVQLAMLGSMLSNMLFVFGLGCLVGGLRWQVQELRITSGNVNVGMLLAATAGALLPAALVMSGELGSESTNPDVPAPEIVTFSRVNAAVMMILYLSFLLFTLGTHKEEFDEDETVVETEVHQLLLAPHYTQRHAYHGGHGKAPAKRNTWCLHYITKARPQRYEQAPQDLELTVSSANGDNASLSSTDTPPGSSDMLGDATSPNAGGGRRRRQVGLRSPSLDASDPTQDEEGAAAAPDSIMIGGRELKDHGSDADGLMMEDDNSKPEAQMSFRTGIVWLFVITLCISAMSDILVDTIDGFASKLEISEVFTSMVIVPFFSNVAEQVSAVLFAYRNEMDLCVGVTVGSAIQVALFVLPGCVLVGWMVDRSMTLFFGGYETCCLFFGVVTIAAVLQGGTTNWLVGMFCIGVYMMLATGFWFHNNEDLSTDEEIAIQNMNGTRELY